MSWLHSSSRDRKSGLSVLFQTLGSCLLPPRRAASLNQCLPVMRGARRWCWAASSDDIYHGFAPSVSKQGQAMKANGAGSWLWERQWQSSVRTILSARTCWLISMLLILLFLPAGVVERVWDWRFGDTEFTFKVWGPSLSASSLGYKVSLFSGSNFDYAITLLVFNHSLSTLKNSSYPWSFLKILPCSQDQAFSQESLGSWELNCHLYAGVLKCLTSCPLSQVPFLSLACLGRDTWTFLIQL